jgi:probable F420-dependent oxidoreductase
MVEFAINTIGHEAAIHPSELGTWAEENGFSALYFGEHTHIPVSSVIPASIFPEGMPHWYKEFYDPFISLMAAGATTTSLKLGLAICLVAQHHPIELAKKAATLDRLSGGRLLFGIGGGWNREEMADFGVEYAARWETIREKVIAIREIWTSKEAEYHGAHVDFDPIWCWPKPLQTGGPPIIMGASGKAAPRRIAEYCNGWMPIDGAHDVEKLMVQIREEMEKVDRSMDELDLTVITGHADSVDEQRIEMLFKLGFHRISFFIAPGPPSEQWPVLENRAEVVRRFSRYDV